MRRWSSSQAEGASVRRHCGKAIEGQAMKRFLLALSSAALLAGLTGGSLAASASAATFRINWSDGTYADVRLFVNDTATTGKGAEVFTDEHKDSGNLYRADGVF